MGYENTQLATHFVKVAMQISSPVAVSYTHLDVYKRQGSSSMGPLAMQQVTCFKQILGIAYFTVGYPSHSPHLNITWCILKEAIFRENPPATKGKLLEKIVTCATGMKQPLFKDMLENVRKHHEYCLKCNREHFKNVLFLIKHEN